MTVSGSSSGLAAIASNETTGNPPKKKQQTQKFNKNYFHPIELMVKNHDGFGSLPNKKVPVSLN